MGSGFDDLEELMVAEWYGLKNNDRYYIMGVGDGVHYGVYKLAKSFPDDKDELISQHDTLSEACNIIDELEGRSLG